MIIADVNTHDGVISLQDKLSNLMKEKNWDAIGLCSAFLTELLEEKHHSILGVLENYTQDMKVYRGNEYKLEDYKKLVADIKENSQYHFYVTKDGEKFQRFAYGNEHKDLGMKYIEKHNLLDYEPGDLRRKLKYCGACEAKQGEYHLEDCDMEVCPKCFNQLISCECIENLSSE
jgi:hypothetical protein